MAADPVAEHLIEQMRKLIDDYERTQRRTSETKSAQINVRVTPSLRARVQNLAAELDMSISDLIEQAVCEFAERNGASVR